MHILLILQHSRNISLMINVKYIVLFITNFTFLSCFSQTTSEIDNLNLAVKNQSIQGKYNTAIKTAYEAIKLSEKINYEKGAQEGFYSIAMILSNLGEYDKSISYAKKAEEYQAYLKDNPGAQLELLALQIFNYNDLGFPSMAASIYQKALSTALKEKNNKKRNRYLLNLYTISHLAYKDEKIVYNNFSKAKNIISDSDNVFDDNEPLENILMTKTDVYGKLANYHFTKKNLDSSRYYYNAIESLTGKMQNKAFVEAIILDGYSQISEEQGNYSDALNYLTRAEKIIKSYKVYRNLIPIYERKSQLYQQLNDSAKEQEYINLYRKLSDSLLNAENKGRDAAILKLLESKEQEVEKFHKDKRTREIIVAGVIFLITVTVSYLLFRKFLKRKSEAILENQQKLNDHQQELLKKNQENEQLKLKINESFEEVVILAKDNSPEFLTRFQEIYPDFCNNILKKNSSLQITELRFCALLFLNFSTKEIAHYTFTSIKTVQNRKNNIRKRLNIPSDVDIYVWFSDLLIKTR